MSSRNRNSSVKGIAFDLGDTLIGTGTLMLAGAEYAAQQLHSAGLILDEEKLVRTFLEADDMSDFPHINHLFSHIEISQEALAESGVIDPDTTLSTLTIASAFLAYYRHKVRQLVQPNTQLISLLGKLRARDFLLGVISNGTLEGQIEVMTRLGILRYFDDILISEEIGVEKPDPEIFRTASERLGMEPESILFIGDSWETDILGAAAVGFQVALSVQYAQDKTRTREGIDIPGCAVIESIEDVLHLLHIE